jgi:hypothetical protein
MKGLGGEMGLNRRWLEAGEAVPKPFRHLHEERHAFSPPAPDPLPTPSNAHHPRRTQGVSSTAIAMCDLEALGGDRRHRRIEAVRSSTLGGRRFRLHPAGDPPQSSPASLETADGGARGRDRPARRLRRVHAVPRRSSKSGCARSRVPTPGRALGDETYRAVSRGQQRGGRMKLLSALAAVVILSRPSGWRGSSGGCSRCSAS